jgi:response regulator RpfG family c-di-GMP phosphodiesterase
MGKLDCICIIDDDDIYTFLLKKTLVKSNICSNIKSFDNGLAGLEGIKTMIENKETLPDLILLDINMPLFDGWEFLEEFKKLKHLILKPISIYIVSSSISQADINKAKFNEEVIDFLTKPIESSKIRSICDLHLFSNN